MRILQINKLYSPWIGGIETVAKDVAEYFNSTQDVEVVNLVCQAKGKRNLELVEGVSTYRAASWAIVSGMPISLDFFVLFRQLIQRADIIVLHHPFPLAFVAYRIFGRNKKLIVWYHSDIVKQSYTKIPFMPFIRSALKSAAHIIVSNGAITRTSKVLRDFTKKCKVVYFGIETNRFAASPDIRKNADALRNQFGTPLILCVGRLVYYKGYQYLIEAMNDVPGAHLLIIGNGPERAMLMQEISRHGLQSRVSIIDPVDDLVPYYHACDLFALPSSEPSEVFGIVQIEAMACGKPVVNTNLPTGVPEISLDHQTGRTVPPKNATALAAAINEILGDRQEYKRLSENALVQATRRFSKAHFFAEVEKILLS